MNTPSSADRLLRLTTWLESVGQDLRYGARQLIKAPGFSVTAIVTIALGIGACTAIFSVADKYLLHPTDYDEPEQIVYVWESSAKIARMGTTSGVFHAWQTQSTVFADLAATYNSPPVMQLTEGDRVARIGSDFISPNYLRTLRLRPELGREFAAEEYISGKGDVVLLSRSLWQTRFGGRTNVIGEVIHLDDKPYTVVGVINDPFRRYEYILLPGSLTQTENFTERTFSVMGRLKSGATIAQAQAELDVISARIAAAHPAAYKGQGVRILGFVALLTHIAGPLLWPLVGAVGLLLLIACVNVANLLMIRAGARRREIAVRLALGARRGRLVRQLLAESLLLCIIGGVLGVILAWSITAPLAAASALPRSDRIAIDGSVLAGSFGLILVTSLGIGLMPALQATNGNLADALNDGGYQSTGGRRQRVRSALVILEIAGAFVLLVGTGLMAHTLRAMQQFDRGLTSDPVYVAWMTLDSRRLYDTPEKIAGFTRGALEQIQALADVMSAAFTNGVPPGRGSSDGFILEGQSRPAPLEPTTTTDIFAVTPDFFRSLGIPLISGRELTAHDGVGGAPVVLINREIARKYFPDQDPVGRRILLLGDTAWSEIVGVVGDVRDPFHPLRPQLYRPVEKASSRTFVLVLKVTHNSPALSRAVQGILAGMDPALTTARLEPLEQTLSDNNWRRLRFNLTLLGMFSGFALLLATLGIYGVTAYAVAQRTREIGIRMALGAAPREILRLILRSGVRVVGIGILVGAGVALASTRILDAFLYGTSPYDPMTFVEIAVALSLTSLIACVIPARRAAKVEPLTALRHE